MKEGRKCAKLRLFIISEDPRFPKKFNQLAKIDLTFPPLNLGIYHNDLTEFISACFNILCFNMEFRLAIKTVTAVRCNCSGKF